MVLALQMLACLVAVLFVVYSFYISRKRSKSSMEDYKVNSYDELLTSITYDVAELLKEQNFDGVNYKKYEAAVKAAKRVETAFRDCVTGNREAKKVAKSTIKDLIGQNYARDLEEVNQFIDFTNLEMLEPQLKMELLIKKYGYNVMYEIDNKFNIIKPVELNGVSKCEIDGNRMDEIFAEMYDETTLDYYNALDVLTIRIYQDLKGFGIIDSIADCNIDGYEIGTSGSTRYIITGDIDIPYKITNSFWIQIKATWIHLSFYDFETAGEVRRLVANISSVPGSRPLVESAPIKVVESWDGSRISSARPPVSDSWSVYVRKFGGGYKSVSSWLNPEGIHNGELPEKLLYYLSKADQNLAFTGQQNTGKTTLMKGQIENFNPGNIRVFEMSFELELRELYPHLNQTTFKPTQYATNNNVQDFIKKTDGMRVVLGEVAEADVAYNALQFANVAAKSVIFSNHAKDDQALINYFVRCVIAMEGSSIDSAMDYVLDALKHNIKVDFHGTYRVIKEITEIVKGEMLIPYDDIEEPQTVQEAIHTMTKLNKEYYTRRTDRVRFHSKQIIRFNTETNTYEANECYSEYMYNRIIESIPTDEDKQGFIEFYNKNWIYTPKQKSILEAKLKEQRFKLNRSNIGKAEKDKRIRAIDKTLAFYNAKYSEYRDEV